VRYSGGVVFDHRTNPRKPGILKVNMTIFVATPMETRFLPSSNAECRDDIVEVFALRDKASHCRAGVPPVEASDGVSGKVLLNGDF
jgi:hypothetical protein